MPKPPHKRQSSREHDARRRAEQPWRRLYNTARWQRVRAGQLQAHPLCAYCARDGKVTVATVCHHVVPHRGDEERFFAGPFASLCADCHDMEAQEEDVRGYSSRVDTHGWPVDPKHPSNRAR